eukprot:3997185-Amphidinium_carterae.1
MWSTYLVVLLIDDVLEFGDLASGALYTYTALKEGYGEYDPGCNGLAFVAVDRYHSTRVQCSADSHQDSFCSGGCRTDPNVLYKAVPQDCQQHLTEDCARVKQVLAIASFGAMIASVLCSTAYHTTWCYRFAYGNQILEVTRTQGQFCFSVCMLMVPIPFVLALVVGCRCPGLFPEVAMSGIGVLFFGNVCFSYREAHRFQKDAEELSPPERQRLEMLGLSHYLQVPLLSVVTQCALHKDDTLLELLYIARSGFKFRLRIVQDIPDFIISVIDMFYFDLSAINILDLAVSVVEMVHYLLLWLHIHAARVQSRAQDYRESRVQANVQGRSSG